jgi:UDP-glucose 4-epimerase
VIAVTGAAGFIGRAVCDELRMRGYEVREIDRAYGVDVLGPHLAEELNGCKAVIHLAGILGTHELFAQAEQAVQVNVNGCLRVLDCCQKYGLGFVSITMPQIWNNVYTATKAATTRLACGWHETFGVPVSFVRAFNVYGPGQHYGTPQKIIPTFAVKAWRNEPLPIWGTGEQLVDLVYTPDVARMLVDALEFGDCQTFDAGTGKGMTVNQVAELVIGMIDSDSTVEHLPMRRGETPGEKRTIATGEGWDLLGWHPRWDEQHLADTVNWYGNIAFAHAGLAH